MTQPEPLRLADALEKWAKDYASTEDWDAMGVNSANCLRRLHEELEAEKLMSHTLRHHLMSAQAVNQEFLEALQEIATAFVSETAPEAYLMQTARNAIAKATGESK